VPDGMSIPEGSQPPHEDLSLVLCFQAFPAPVRLIFNSANSQAIERT
jgi:hypothetical protein